MRNKTVTLYLSIHSKNEIIQNCVLSFVGVVRLFAVKCGAVGTVGGEAKKLYPDNCDLNFVIND